MRFTVQPVWEKLDSQDDGVAPWKIVLSGCLPKWAGVHFSGHWLEHVILHSQQRDDGQLGKQAGASPAATSHAAWLLIWMCQPPTIGSASFMAISGAQIVSWGRLAELCQAHCQWLECICDGHAAAADVSCDVKCPV